MRQKMQKEAELKLLVGDVIYRNETIIRKWCMD